MKKRRFFCICLILLFSALPFMQASASYNTLLEELEPRSDIILLQSLEDGTIIFDKNIHRRTPPASLTKIVTAILTLENCTDLETMVAVPQSVLDSLVNTGSSNAGLKAGEEVTVHDLLRCMLIPSANEAAGTLAYYISGGNIPLFVEKMNEFVLRLGCEDTHFTTPHGLDDPEQYTSAADMAKIMNYALKSTYSDIFTDIIGADSYTLPASNMHEKERRIRTTNFLMNSGYKDYYCKYVTGGKTGSTSTAGKCVAATAYHSGYSYLCIVLAAPHDDIDQDGVDENGAFTDTKLLLEWVYKNIVCETVLSASDVTAEVKVRLSSKTDHVALVPREDVLAYVPAGVDDKSVLVKVAENTMPQSVDAPIMKGEKIAEAAVYYADQEIAHTDLVAAESVERNPILYIGSLIQAFFRNTVVRIIFGVLALLIVAYIALTIHINRKKRRMRRRKKVVRMQDYQ